MKKITQIVICLLGSAAFAQPVINSTDFDNINYAFFSKSTSSATVNQGAAGADVIWNFSTFILTANPDDIDGTTIMKVPTGPLSGIFSDSNYVLKFGKILNAGIGNIFHAYYNKTASKLEILGSGGGTQIKFSLINASTVFVYPSSFGMFSTDTSQETGSSLVDTNTITYDTYGTFITSFGTFTNVIRLKRETAGSSYVGYDWITGNPYQEIASAEIDLNGTFYISVKQPAALANESFTASKITFYPNPATSVLNIKISDNS